MAHSGLGRRDANVMARFLARWGGYLIMVVALFQVISINAADATQSNAPPSRLERLYLQHAAPLSGKYTAKNIAVVMLFARHAQEKRLPALRAQLAHDLLPIFSLEPDLFVDQLKQLPSLTQPVCELLGAFAQTQRDPERHRQLPPPLTAKLQDALPEQQARACLAEVDKASTPS
ncbi:hypothetical protein [Teredinibacter turnerae]|uniref:hypothetical protein n=1 Tax=Teredinibacter turnerae TaxID=2426 RepID=UPI00048F469D|nr:hypothetical protein [Teredinibacter turnerae]